VLSSPIRLVALAAVLVAAVGVVAFAATVPLGSTAPGASVIVISGSPLLNKAAPAIDLVTPAGTRVRLADYTGRPVIVNFWASWCIPCRDEFPQFVEARKQYAAAGLEILGIVHQDSADAATAFANQHGATWPILMDPQNAAWNAYLGSVGVPMTFFIDRSGIIRATSYGPVTAATLPGQLATIL
jgi:cytochrome c biogenesis protein CcmG, thiol:disulfide interchange protein DsbE